MAKGKFTPKKSTPAKSSSKKSNGVPFGLDAIEQFNADREATEPDNVDEDESVDEEEALTLGLSDEEDYDWDGEGEGEEGEDYEGEGFDFDEDAYDRQEQLKQLDEEDIEIMGRKKQDPADKPFSERLTVKDIHKTSREAKEDLEEAKRLQKEQRQTQNIEDFDLDDATPAVTKKTPKKSKSKEEKMLDTFNADLEDIDLGKTEVQTLKKKLTEQDKAANIKEKIALIKQTSPELLTLLKDFREKIHEVQNVTIPVLAKAKSNELPTSEGISFLEVKNQLLLSYCINISFYLMLKAQGKQVKDHPVVDQLVRIRAILEKARPIEKKLSYQIDKLVRTANIGAEAAPEEDELDERPRPADLEVDSEEEEADSLGFYRAPKGAEEAMEETETMADRQKKRQKERAKRSQMAEVLHEFGDAPEESTPGLASDAYERTAMERDLDELEEARFKRMPITKADKARHHKRMEQVYDVMAGREDFGDMAALDDDPDAARDKEYLARKRMRAHMDQIDTRKRSLKEKIDGDEDTHVQAKKTKIGPGSLGHGMLFDEEIESEEEVEERRPQFEQGAVPNAEEELEEGGKRKAGKKIEDNRGLRQIRSKDRKTPHLRYKNAYKKKVGQMGNSHKVRSQDKQYSGEKRISKNVSRSKSYTHQ